MKLGQIKPSQKEVVQQKRKEKIAKGFHVLEMFLKDERMKDIPKTLSFPIDWFHDERTENTCNK